MFRQNIASQTVCAGLVSVASGTAVTSGTTTVYYLGDGATQTAASAAAVHEGNGCWSFGPSQAETNFNHVAYTFVNSSAIPITVQAWPVAFDPTDTVRAGLTALPNAAANAAGGLPISAGGGLALDTQLANTNEVTAARMGALTDWINGGRLDLILDIIAADTTTDIPALIATAQADLDTITDGDGVILGAAGVDLIWDEPKVGHVGAGSVGEEIQSHSLSTEVAALNDLSAAAVNAEVVDVIDVDTRAEPAQGTPGATISLGDKVDFLYKAWRNKSTQTVDTYSLMNDDAATVDHKATVSDDGTTFTKGEVASGP